MCFVSASTSLKINMNHQFMVMASTQLAAISVGGFMAFPTQVLQQLKSNESTIVLDMNTSSWIGSIFGLAGIPVIFLPIIMQWRGRKFAYNITCAFIIAGWSIALFATNTALLLTSEVFQGLSTNSLMPVSCLIMTEMISPKYRTNSMQIFGVSLTVGMAIVGISGQFIHYRIFSIIMLVPTILAVVLSFLWPESPMWFALKGEFDKCERAFVWLRGKDESSKKELQLLISAQKENIAIKMCKQRITMRSIWAQITSRDFYIPCSHIFILQNMLYWSGGDVIMVYFLVLVEKSTQSKNAVFYAGILLYAIIFIAAVITNFTVRLFKNKTVLLSSTCGVILALVCTSVVTYLQSIDFVAKDSYLCMYCLLGFMTFNGLGLNALVFSIGAELMPVKHRGLGGALFIIFNCGLYASTLKLSPYIMMYLEMWGMFTMFTINAMVCAFIVWKYVPETKNRILLELEDFYAYGHFINRDVTKEEPLCG